MLGVQVSEHNFVPKENRFAFLLFDDGLELFLLGFGPGQAFGLLHLVFQSIHLIIDLEGRSGEHLKQRLPIIEHIESRLIFLKAIGLEIQFGIRVTGLGEWVTISM